MVEGVREGRFRYLFYFHPLCGYPYGAEDFGLILMWSPEKAFKNNNVIKVGVPAHPPRYIKRRV